LDTFNTDSDTHEHYLKVLSDVYEKNSKFFHVVWINGPAQPGFLRELNLYSGFPSVVMLNHKKTSAVLYVGSFSTAALNDFAGSVMRGKRAFELKAFPTIVKAEPIPPAGAESSEDSTEDKRKDEL